MRTGTAQFTGGTVARAQFDRPLEGRYVVRWTVVPEGTPLTLGARDVFGFNLLSASGPVIADVAWQAEVRSPGPLEPRPWSAQMLEQWAVAFGLTRQIGETDEALYARMVRALQAPVQAPATGRIDGVDVVVGDSIFYAAGGRGTITRRPVLTGSAAEIVAQRKAEPPLMPQASTEDRRFALLEVDEGPLSEEIQAYLRDWRLRQARQRVLVERAPLYVRLAAEVTGYRGEN